MTEPSSAETSPALGAPRAVGGYRTLLVLLALLGAARLLFPGDVPFINAEPRIMIGAITANEAGTLASAGLVGTRGARYGPVPTWMYQGLLAVTSDLRVVALARAAAVTALTAWALVLLARSVGGLVPWLGAFAFLSPYLWLYSRDLWDNSFGVPFSALCVGAYARFVATDRVGWLAVSVGFGTACLLTHLMTVPVVLAIAVHFLSTRWRDLIASPRFAGSVLAVALVAGLVAGPYLLQVATADGTGFALSPDPPSLAFAMAGLRVFSLAGFDYFIGPWDAGGVGAAMRAVSLLVFPAGAYGFFLLLRRAQEAETSPRREIARLLLYALLFFVLLANAQRLEPHPHYYSGVWAVFFCAWWVGMSDLLERPWARWTFVAQAAVMGLFLVGLAGWLHLNGGTRSLRYGPTLANQMAVAAELDRLGVEQPPRSLALHPSLFPQAIQVLRYLDVRGGGDIADAPARPGTYQIEYEEPEGSTGTIVVRAVGP